MITGLDNALVISIVESMGTVPRISGLPVAAATPCDVRVFHLCNIFLYPKPNQVDPETFFPVQRVLWHSRPVPHVKDGQEGHSAVPINTPDECDHSPVHLRPPVHLPRRGGRVNRGRKRSRGMSECDHEREASARSAEENQGHAQKRRPSPVQDVMGSAPVAPPAEGAPIAISAPSSLVNYGSAGTEEVGSENEGVGGTPGKDVLTSSPSTSPGLEDGTPTSVEGVQRLRSLSIEEEGGDEAVMALMGFSGFRGGQR